MKPAIAFIHDLHISQIFLAGLVPHPHPGISVIVPARSPKSVVKALHHVANYLRKEQKAARKAAQPTVKVASRALATELTATLQAYLAPAPDTAGKLPKAVAKPLARLATKLVKQRRRQVEKAYKKALKHPLDTAAPAAPAAPATLRLPLAAGRAASRKRPAAKTVSPLPAPSADHVNRPPAN